MSEQVEAGPQAKALGLNATLIQRDDFNPELSVFHVRLDGGPIAPFEPGQYTTLGLPNDPGVKGPKLIRRAYSIASSPNLRTHMEFLIVLVTEGQLTPRLWKMKVGDPIFMDTKCKGHFTLDNVGPENDLVLISTGTGIAPFMSMFDTYRQAPRWRRLIMINGVRHAPDLAYREQLETLQRSGEMTYIPMVTRDPEWTGIKGRIPTLLEGDAYERAVGEPLDPRRAHVFLCGNPDMITQITEMLEPRGFKTHSKREPGNLHFEKYW